MGDTKLSTTEIITLVAGGVVLISGVLPFFDFSELDESYNVLTGDFGAFGLGTFVWLCGVLAALAVVLPKFANMKLPEQILGFTIDQVRLVLAGFSAVVMVFWLITGDQPDKGIGFWLILLGSIGLVVAEIMRLQESSSTAPGAAPPTPF